MSGEQPLVALGQRPPLLDDLRQPASCTSPMAAWMSVIR